MSNERGMPVFRDPAVLVVLPDVVTWKLHHLKKQTSFYSMIAALFESFGSNSLFLFGVRNSIK